MSVTFFSGRAKRKGVWGKLFAHKRQTASACPIGQNAETKFSSLLFEFFMGGVRNPKIEEENFVEAPHQSKLGAG